MVDLQFSGVVIEQLNAAQWHARYPDGQAGGVGGWLPVLIEALSFADVEGCPVASVDLEGERMLVVRSSPGLFERNGSAR